VARLLLAVALSFYASSAFAQPGDWTYRGNDRERGVHVRLLRDYRLPPGRVTREPVIVIGGSAVIDGRAEDDVIVVGGTLRVGPEGEVRGDAVAVGGRVIVDANGRVAGTIDQVAVAGPDARRIWNQAGGPWWAAAALGTTVVRLTIALIVALLLTVVAPGWVSAVGERAASPGSMMLLGLTGQILFVPALLAIAAALVISVVGVLLLPGLPLLVAAAAVAWAAGFAAVAGRLGRRMRGRGAPPSPVLDLLTGFAAICVVTLTAHAIALGPGWTTPPAVAAGVAGLAIEYVAWTVGLGAALAQALGGRPRPPRLPIHASVATPTAT
jgi:hypothetical protein